MNQTAHPWHAATSSSNFTRNTSQHQPLPLKNRYSILRVEDKEIPEINEDVAAKKVLKNIQFTSDKSSFTKSAANKKRKPNKGTKISNGHCW